MKTKRILTLLTAALLVLSLAACGTGKESKKATATPTVSKTKPESPAKEQPKVTVTAKTGSKPEEKPTVKAKEQAPKVTTIPANPVKPQSTAVAVIG